MIKNLSLLVFIGLMIFTTQAQSYQGSWQGTLTVGPNKLQLIFHIMEDAGTHSASLAIPEQGVKNIMADSVLIQGEQIGLVFNSLQATYSGKLEDADLLVGVFKQMNQSLELNLSKITPLAPLSKANQNNPKGIDFIEKEVTFYNGKDSLMLCGTLTYPKKGNPFPAVILISGSGPQNRDSEIAGQKPFKIIAEYLSQHGIAVLRYDERGIGCSEGKFSNATSYDFSKDAESALLYLATLPYINPGKIGIIGHSEGGIVAPMVANRNDKVSFLISMAGPVLPGDEILFLQQRKIGKTMGLDDEKIKKALEFNKKAFDLVKTEKNEAIELKLRELFKIELETESVNLPEGMSQDQYIDLQINQLTSPWFKNFISYDPRNALKKLTCKTLFLFGGKDLQVPSNENVKALRIIEEERAKNNFETKILESHNHLFQIAETGSPMEYGSIKHSISDKALKVIYDWIKLEVIGNIGHQDKRE